MSLAGKYEKFKVLGYIRPSEVFHSLEEWEWLVLKLIKLQSDGLDTRAGKISCKAASFCSTEDFEELRSSMEKLQLNDASLVFTPESSAALGFGFRCGFLGMLHMEIIQERLEREFDMTVITTVPNVSYHAFTTKDTETPIIVNNPSFNILLFTFYKCLLNILKFEIKMSSTKAERFITFIILNVC